MVRSLPNENSQLCWIVGCQLFDFPRVLRIVTVTTVDAVDNQRIVTVTTVDAVDHQRIVTVTTR